MKKVFIDTNYFLRLLIGDIPQQQKSVRKLFKEIENDKTRGIVSILVVNELIWILENFYNKQRKEYIHLILELISLKNIKIEEIKKEDLIKILKTMEKKNLDFTDLYLNHFGKKYKYKISTFDKKLSKLTENHSPIS